jgi:hypothetical protein
VEKEIAAALAQAKKAAEALSQANGKPRTGWKSRWKRN